MSKLHLVPKIRDVYSRGGNMMEFLRSSFAGKNDTESIMISYDFQAGSYIKEAAENPLYIEKYTNAILTELKKLGSIDSIMEVGVGEATIMSPLMKKFDPNNNYTKFGFDISWSRVRYAVQHAQSFGQNIGFFTANLFNIPLVDNSIDIVYTSHSLEPNGGMEKAALMELYRVASKFIVLLEPDYDGASEEARARMDSHGYVKNLTKVAQSLGYDIMIDRPFNVYNNPLNPTRLTIIRKLSTPKHSIQFICPVSNKPLERVNSNWYCKDSGLLYPEINNIPCLQQENAILALSYLHFNE